MAFPVVGSRSSGIQGANSLIHAITLPSGIVAGDLLLLVFSVDGAPTCSTTSPGWVKLDQASNGTTATGAIFYKFATGSDDCTIDTSASEQSTHVCLRISGAGTPTGTSSNGSSTNSNPPSHNAGASADHLWIATRSGDATVVATVSPANYANLQTQAGGNSGASTNTAERNLTAQTEDPGTFTSATEQWVSYTIAVPPKQTITGTGAITAPPATTLGTAKLSFLGTATVIAAAVLLAASGGQVFSGSGSLASPPAQLAGEGTVSGGGPPPITGTGSIAAPAVSLAGQGKLVFKGQAVLTASPVVLTAAGIERFAGAGGIAAQPTGVVGAGAESFKGTGSFVAPVAELAGAGKQGFSGAGALAGQPAELLGEGTVTPSAGFTGAGSITAPPATFSGEGTVEILPITGTGAFSAPPAALAGTGKLRFKASGSVTSSPAAIASTGAQRFEASGGLIAPLAQLAGTGQLAFRGSGGITAQPAELDGRGVIPYSQPEFIILLDKAVGSISVSAGTIGSASIADQPIRRIGK